MIEVLKQAVAVIKQWHGPLAWDIYYNNAPEMKAIRETIQQFEKADPRPPLKKLDEKGFVFIGNDQKPYLCRMIENVPWFCYWHPDKRWVTLRQCNQQEVWAANKKELAPFLNSPYHKEAGIIE